MTGVFDVRERDLAFVPRWTITRNIRQQNVAEHSFFVDLWATRIAKSWDWDYERLYNLSMYAKMHDVYETLSGDIPSPFKSALKNGGNSLDYAESYLSPLINDTPEKYTVEDGSWDDGIIDLVKFCDLVEALIKIAEETSMGNGTLQSCRDEIMGKICFVVNKLPCTEEGKLDLIMSVETFERQTITFMSGVTREPNSSALFETKMSLRGKIKENGDEEIPFQ